MLGSALYETARVSFDLTVGRIMGRDGTKLYKVDTTLR